MDAKVFSMLCTGFGETLYMVLLSTFIAYVIGLPLGLLLVVTDKDGIKPNRVVNGILGFAINILRSVPFIILLILMLPITRAMVGTTLGAIAVVPPLVVCSAPYIARMVESSIKEVDGGVIEAAQSMGASTGRIVFRVLIPEAKPSLLVGAAIVLTTVLGYTTMAGFVGGGGLGDIAVRYGYYRYDLTIMIIAVIIMIIIVQIFQEVGMRLSKYLDKRLH